MTKAPTIFIQHTYSYLVSICQGHLHIFSDDTIHVWRGHLLISVEDTCPYLVKDTIIDENTYPYLATWRKRSTSLWKWSLRMSVSSSCSSSKSFSRCCFRRSKISSPNVSELLMLAICGKQMIVRSQIICQVVYLTNMK